MKEKCTAYLSRQTGMYGFREDQQFGVLLRNRPNSCSIKKTPKSIDGTLIVDHDDDDGGGDGG